MDDQDYEQRRQFYRGAGDSWVRAFEFALTPPLFGSFGYLLDRVLGLTPLFTLVMVVFAVVGLMVRAYYAYAEDMKRHEAAAPWALKPQEPAL